MQGSFQGSIEFAGLGSRCRVWHLGVQGLRPWHGLGFRGLGFRVSLPKSAAIQRSEDGKHIPPSPL